MDLNRTTTADTIKHPERILQFGEGNFLRAFADWMIDRMNKEADFNSGVVAVQPIEHGLAELINKQDGLYHVLLKGMKDGKPVKETHRVDCITRALNPYAQYEEYIQLASSEDLRFIISNTTEAGISFDSNDSLEMTPQCSFPAKMTSFLYKRFQAFNGATDKGLIVICCELIDRNADILFKYILQYTELWNLGDDFKIWLKEACAFCNSLVDRIVPGFPKENINEVQKELGYNDQLVTVGEYFHLWVIEAPEWVQKEFPADKAGLEVKFVEDMTSFREQKVRILNGAHTGSFAVSLLYGLETVREAIEHPVVGKFMNELVFDDILSILDGSKDYLEQFATKILERFYNPYIKHQWRSIALNSMSKWETRDLPSLLDFNKKYNQLPTHLVFSLAALIAYYKGELNGEKYELQDDQKHLDFMKSCWETCDRSKESTNALVKQVLAYKDNWNLDLNEVPGLTAQVSEYLYAIEQEGMQHAINLVLNTVESTQN
ncbi:tagaturonate reductase [Puteibacter caeruleilacunae]|nr:tagaturonate reductase [Puteibacter caeruleilacunae]